MGVLSTSSLDTAPASYQQKRMAHWNQLAEEMDVRHGKMWKSTSCQWVSESLVLLIMRSFWLTRLW